MNYHFFIDEKFVNDFIGDADKIDANQQYVVLSKEPLKFVSHTKAKHLNYGDQELDHIVSSIKVDDRIFVHWFSPSILKLIDQIPSSTPVYLMFWGGDFLESNFPSGRNSQLDDFLYDSLTHQYVKESNRNSTLNLLKRRLKAAKESSNFNNIVHTRIQNFKLKKQLKNGHLYLEEKKIRQRFLKRIEAICHWNHFDIAILENLYQVKLKQLDFIYNVGVEEMVQPRSNSEHESLRIWLGNSDTPTNNHLDALASLEHLKEENIKIICPLNYGNKEYGDLVERAGKQIFGDKFQAIRDYIDRDAYYNLMNETDVALMFHNRGQAGGNVLAFLKKGIKVYMKDQSSICKLFREYGIEIYSANKFHSLSFEDLRTPISKKVIDQNIELINSTIGNEEKRIKALEAIILGQHSN